MIMMKYHGMYVINTELDYRMNSLIKVEKVSSRLKAITGNTKRITLKVEVDAEHEHLFTKLEVSRIFYKANTSTKKLSLFYVDSDIKNLSNDEINKLYAQLTVIAIDSTKNEEFENQLISAIEIKEIASTDWYKMKEHYRTNELAVYPPSYALSTKEKQYKYLHEFKLNALYNYEDVKFITTIIDNKKRLAAIANNIIVDIICVGMDINILGEIK